MFIPGNNKSIERILKEHDYILTIDYFLKILNVHERFQANIPTIISGETDVGKEIFHVYSSLYNEYKFKNNHAQTI
jgi:hypothetical protein